MGSPPILPRQHDGNTPIIFLSKSGFFPKPKHITQAHHLDWLMRSILLANANLLKRLVTLEIKNIKATPLCIIYQADNGLTPEQQAQLDEADATQSPVLLIRINNAENLCHD